MECHKWRNSEWFQAMETSLYREKCGDSQRTRREDCVVFAHHAYPGFYTTLGGDTEDSTMKVPVGGATLVQFIDSFPRGAGDYSLNTHGKVWTSGDRLRG
jgi:hypothetical protein